MYQNIFTQELRLLAIRQLDIAFCDLTFFKRFQEFVDEFLGLSVGICGEDFIEL